MKTITLGTLQIHNNTDNTIGYMVASPVEGFDFPSVRISSYNRPGQEGAELSNALYGMRRIVLTGRVWGDSISEYEAARRALQSACRHSHSSAGVVQTKTLKVTTLNNLSVQIEVIVRRLRMDVENVLNSRFFIEMDAHDYQILSQTLSSEIIQVPTGTGLTYPVTYPVTYGSVSGGNATVTNDGEAIAWPTISLAGPLTNPFIRNNTTGKTLQLTVTIASGETYVVDMKNKTIVKGGASQYDKLTAGSEFWWLDPGDNDIDFNTSDSADTGSCTISYRDSYLGL